MEFRRFSLKFRWHWCSMHPVELPPGISQKCHLYFTALFFRKWWTWCKSAVTIIGSFRTTPGIYGRYRIDIACSVKVVKLCPFLDVFRSIRAHARGPCRHLTKGFLGPLGAMFRAKSHVRPRIQYLGREQPAVFNIYTNQALTQRPALNGDVRTFHGFFVSTSTQRGL